MRVSFLGFARFAVAPPGAKVAALRRVKAPRAYDPRTDWWKQLREFLPRNHRESGTPEDILEFASSVHPRKIASYNDRAATYASWWGGSEVSWSGGSSRIQRFPPVEINVNPELFLRVDGAKLVMKLYFSGRERLSDDRAALMVRLLARAYSGQRVAVLDLSTGRLYEPHPDDADMDPVIVGEAAALAAMWDAVA
jgi:hypothetical protein